MNVESPVEAPVQQQTQVRREIPIIVTEAMRESPSGSHPML